MLQTDLSRPVREKDGEAATGVGDGPTMGKEFHGDGGADGAPCVGSGRKEGGEERNSVAASEGKADDRSLVSHACERKGEYALVSFGRVVEMEFTREEKRERTVKEWRYRDRGEHLDLWTGPDRFDQTENRAYLLIDRQGWSRFPCGKNTNTNTTKSNLASLPANAAAWQFSSTPFSVSKIHPHSRTHSLYQDLRRRCGRQLGFLLEETFETTYIYIFK
ncbi:unnamed protein product [Lactuca virosa]|uniref:Uncharacterized protein n=1 Tax=Lactuca virosa TaxID=75947 RepID=A0AAU9LUQ3_9ASTR|nr:unnamed protein product [Lactuca virosa]